MLRIVFRVLSRLPLSVLHAIGATLSWCVYCFARGYRHRLKENITAAGYEQHLAAAIAESGKSLSELPFVWGAPIEKVRAKTRVQNWEVVQQAQEAGRGIIFFTPHLGCFEIAGQALGQRLPLTVMYRPPRVASHQPLFEAGRRRTEAKLAATNLSGIRAMAKSLKAGEAIGLLPDHVPRLGDGVWADFFGRPAYTITLSAKLQQMSGAQIILVFAERLSWGRGYVVHFMPFDEDMGGTPEQQARAINAAMEKLIALCPSQYFWSYNRYRQPLPPKRPAASSAPAEEK
ncbi:MAG: lysophospholipid acyltransferase family protein [Oxalobacter sp.]|nr:MAG: lysophospholipid acyltransferase family protein [Oxalobacter sp.]